MTYYQFIQAVEVKVKERIQENVTVSIHTAVKNNGTRRQGLNICLLYTSTGGGERLLE